MKIGIATFHRANNYGAVLQAFALQEYLRNLGHFVFFIEHSLENPRSGLKKYLARTLGESFRRLAHQKRSIVFNKYQSSYLGTNKRRYRMSCSDLEKIPLADAYITGSDQVWNPRYLHDEVDDRVFYLDFGKKNSVRISYAASFGGEIPDAAWRNHYQHYLNKLDHISVRERGAARTLEKTINRKVYWVPDPALMLTRGQYNVKLGIKEAQQNYIFSYMIDIEMLYQNKVKLWYKKTLNAAVREAYSPKYTSVLFGKVLTPRQWVEALASSKYVVTNSFHGVVFSVIYRRPFIVMPVGERVSKMNTRITSLLEQLGLENRIVKKYNPEQLNELYNHSIDWQYVNKKLKEYVLLGNEYIRIALGK